MQRKKRLTTFLLSMLMCMAGVKAFAYDAMIDGIYYFFSGTEAIVTFYSSIFTSNKNAYSGNVSIPGSFTYNGVTYSVTRIGDNAFSHCSDLTSITIPNSVTSIGEYAFGECI